MNKKLTIIVPVFNELQAIPDVAPQIIECCRVHDWAVVFVDDGSRDGSGNYLETLVDSSTVTLIRHKVNRGYGSAIKTGILNVKTPYCVTIDADGQHNLQNVEELFAFALEKDADLVIGNRGQNAKFTYRNLGKRLILIFTRSLIHLPVEDLNSGMKLYRTELAKRYQRVCPDSMSFSDVIVLVFVKRGDYVCEYPIQVFPRKAGKSTINTYTAFETVLEILNIILMFNPLKIFLPISILSIMVGLVWGVYIMLVVGRGVSVGAVLAIVTGLIFFVLGLLANQITSLRMDTLNN